MKYNLETTSLWRFPNRGNWATHDNKYRGNWSPYIPKNIILRYTKELDTVLDMFVGSGTTLIESKLLNRNGIGIDINHESLEIVKKKLEFNINNNAQYRIFQGSACHLNMVSNSSIDLICTHPPYADIIKYSKNISGDLSLLNYEKFLVELEKVAKESYRVLKKGKICSFMMGDIRKNRNVVPLGFLSMQTYLDAGFILKEIIIKEQFNCAKTNYWVEKSKQLNFYLLAHEYIFIFEK